MSTSVIPDRNKETEQSSRCGEVKPERRLSLEIWFSMLVILVQTSCLSDLKPSNTATSEHLHSAVSVTLQKKKKEKNIQECNLGSTSR